MMPSAFASLRDKRGLRITRLLLMGALLTYWFLSLQQLDTLPTVREDEPWQTAPGYSFWTRGVYGSPLYADFAHMDQRYYLFQPTFSLLLGLAARLWGLGLFQIRIVPVALGALTMCLTFIGGSRIGGRAVGLLAVGLLLVWRWSLGTPIHASGVVLLDESRIARYDALVPVWGMAAWYVFVRARTSGNTRIFLAVGLLAGLAGLAHLYGLFWLGAFALVLFWDGGFRIFRAQPFWLMAAGALLVWAPWLIYIGSDWPDFIAQTSNYAYRFDLLNVGFYLDNLIRELPRYGLSRSALPRALWHPGVWLLALGIPSALVWVWLRAQRLFGLKALAVPSLFFPFMFAMLMWQKIPGYLLSVLPLFVIVIALAAVQLWRARRVRVRLALLCMLLLLALDSAAGIAAQQRMAFNMTPYHVFIQRVRAIVPRSARVLALHQYWLGLAENDFRAYSDVFFLTNSEYTRTPLNLEQAFEHIAPDIFVVDQILGSVIAEGDTPGGSAEAREFALRYHAYMDRHGARELGRLTDATFGTLIVYRVSP